MSPGISDLLSECVCDLTLHAIVELKFVIEPFVKGIKKTANDKSTARSVFKFDKSSQRVF